jgi:hypothetical protein
MSLKIIKKRKNALISLPNPHKKEVNIIGNRKQIILSVSLLIV